MSFKSKSLVAKTINELAASLDIAPRTVRDYLQRGCPGKSGSYVLGTVVAWCKENVWKARTSSADPLLDGEDSPALERYRSARASQEEIRLATMQSNFLPTGEITKFMSLIAAPLREYSARLQRAYGAEALADYEDTLQQVQEIIDRNWPVPVAVASSNQSEKTP